MISKKDKQVIRNFVQSPVFETLKNVIEERIVEIGLRPNVGDSLWETAKLAVGNQEQQRALTQLIQYIYDLAGQADD